MKYWPFFRHCIEERPYRKNCNIWWSDNRWLRCLGTNCFPSYNLRLLWRCGSRLWSFRPGSLFPAWPFCNDRTLNKSTIHFTRIARKKLKYYTVDTNRGRRTWWGRASSFSTATWNCHVADGPRSWLLRSTAVRAAAELEDSVIHFRKHEEQRQTPHG